MDPTLPPDSTTPQLSLQEIESGKTMAILGYIPIALLGPIVCIISVSQKSNAFAVYHARQALAIYISWIVLGLCCVPLMFICIGFPLLIAVNVCGLAFCVIGIVNASGGHCRRLPAIGSLADK